MQRVTVIKLDSNDIKSIIAKHFNVPVEKVKSTGYSYEIIANDDDKDDDKEEEDNGKA